MGSVCSCFGIDNGEDQANNSSTVYSSRIPFRSVTQQFMHTYNLLFRRWEVHPLPAVNGAAILGVSSADDGISDSYRPPPRPLPFDDPRCSRIPCDGLISGGNKFSSHCHEESEPLRSSNCNDSGNGKLSAYASKSGCCKSLKHTSEEEIRSTAYIFPSSEDEDVCPTCLEEYTSDNPRVITQCYHHYHLSCIYEWMERSDICPVCGKVMVFNETT